MNNKIMKLRTEREKNVDKISALQSRIKEIDNQIIELENTDIIGLVRDSGISPEMLAELIRSMKQKPATAIHNRAEEKEDFSNED